MTKLLINAGLVWAEFTPLAMLLALGMLNSHLLTALGLFGFMGIQKIKDTEENK